MNKLFLCLNNFNQSLHFPLRDEWIKWDRRAWKKRRERKITDSNTNAHEHEEDENTRTNTGTIQRQVTKRNEMRAHSDALKKEDTFLLTETKHFFNPVRISGI